MAEHTITFQEANGVENCEIQLFNDDDRIFYEQVGDSVYTDDYGTASVELPNGTYYTLKMLAGYEFVKDSFTVDGSAKTVNFELVPGSFDIGIETTAEATTFAFQVFNAVDFEVSWDGGTTWEDPVTSADTILSNDYEYEGPGEYTVSMRGGASRILFYGSGLTPALLKSTETPIAYGVSGITSCSEMFRTVALGQLMGELFYGLPNIGSSGFEGTFRSGALSGLIPENLFSQNHNVGVEGFRLTFFITSGLSGEIPGKLFYNNINVSGNAFQSTFYSQLNAITSVGRGLFDRTENNTSYLQTFRSNGDLVVDGMEDWAWGNITEATLMFGGCTLPTGQYDKLLIALSKKTLQPDVELGMGGTKHSKGLPEACKVHLEKETGDNWTITDDGDTGRYYDVPTVAGGRLMRYRPRIPAFLTE